MKLIDGKKLAATIRKKITAEIAEMFHVPGLAIILVGDDPASHTYVGLKEEAAKEVGVHFEKFLYPADIEQAAVVRRIEELNARDDIHGIVVQLPLPEGFDTGTIIETITPEKDVDGFHPVNKKMIQEGSGHLVPALVKSILELASSTGFSYEGMRAAILANSGTFADPLSMFLSKRGMEVSIILPPFNDYQISTRESHLIVIAIGQPGFLKGDAVKKNAVLIDVGFNHTAEGVTGDIDSESVKHIAGWLTPVPGGVGPMTVAMLLANTVEACKLQIA
ncbi:MAG: bifunctional 5,10-methylenetetrahydrofolate dehydrogenase/5,10-methenyltetrahydrofolate cyclohydrolase [Parcubacteria group bacterium]